MTNKKQHNAHHHHHHSEDDGKIMTIKEYHQNNIMLFHIKKLYTTDTSVCTLTSVDRRTYLANGIEHHECKTDALDAYHTELIKRNLIDHFFNKIEIEPFDALDADIEVEFLFH